jgi:hypothetical protein
MTQITETVSDAFKTNNMKVVNFYFLANYMLLQVCAVYLIKGLTFQSVLEGLFLFGFAVFMEVVEIIQPSCVMQLIRFWRFNTGRGLALCFLSTIAIRGFFIIGLVSLAMSFALLISPMFTGIIAAPGPIIEIKEPTGEKSGLVTKDVDENHDLESSSEDSLVIVDM